LNLRPKKHKPLSNKELIGKTKMITAQNLPKSCNSYQDSVAKKDTVLQQIITVWHKLPKHIKEAIKLLAKPYGY
jgi:hypothetical protein